MERRQVKFQVSWPDGTVREVEGEPQCAATTRKNERCLNPVFWGQWHTDYPVDAETAARYDAGVCEVHA